MLVNHFFHPFSRDHHLVRFFQAAKRLVLVCDPPFGVLVSPLANTVRRLRDAFFAEKAKKDRFFGLNIKIIYFIKRLKIAFFA
jgi:hypothetical protein